MTGLDTARGPRRAAPPGMLDDVLRRGGRRLRVRRAVTAATTGVALTATAAVAFVPPVTRTARDLASPVLGEPSFEGDEWVRERLPYDEVVDDRGYERCTSEATAVESFGWCSVLRATGTTFSFQLCRTGGTMTLTWDDFGEVGFRVVDPRGVTVWSWPDSGLNMALHDVRFGTGRCRTWTQTWAPDRASAGTFTVVATPTVRDANPGNALPPAATLRFPLR